MLFKLQYCQRCSKMNSKGPVDCVLIYIKVFDVQLNDSMMFCS